MTSLALDQDVERRAAAGEPLARIEAELLDCAPVDEEHRSALWLLAWLCTEDAPAARPGRSLGVG